MMPKEIVGGKQRMCQLEVWPNLLSDSEIVQGTEISSKSHLERESMNNTCHMACTHWGVRGGVVQTVTEQKFGLPLVHACQ